MFICFYTRYSISGQVHERIQRILTRSPSMLAASRCNVIYGCPRYLGQWTAGTRERRWRGSTGTPSTDTAAALGKAYKNLLSTGGGDYGPNEKFMLLSRNPATQDLVLGLFHPFCLRLI